MQLIFKDTTELEIASVKQEYNPEYLDCPVDYIDILLAPDNELSVAELRELFIPEKTEHMVIKGASSKDLIGYTIVKHIRTDYTNERFDTVIRLVKSGENFF